MRELEKGATVIVVIAKIMEYTEVITLPHIFDAVSEAIRCLVVVNWKSEGTVLVSMASTANRRLQFVLDCGYGVEETL